MKKFIIAGLSALLLVGCGVSNEKEEAQSIKEEQVVNASDESVTSFPEGTMPIGEGKVKVITPDGTSEDGNIPTVFVKKDALIQQVELELTNFQKDKETFVFVDNIFEDKHHVTSITQTTVELKQKTLEAGYHTVTAVQFENNDPSGKVINFVQAKFENKPAH
ncbi:hypothetical protein [Bacillus sp. TL12]|uniref:hypothetical protein n=1 Tax=Bacillus sp. TL12 TaxID=2894756 RepID=UPI001F523495|nr:hypothetical protein [Bacillus sp. TL12]MCI0767649.1 hypothetical protein [Bacillus sp. TL12]